jgi:SAM-dependent methyltransferase
MKSLSFLFWTILAQTIALATGIFAWDLSSSIYLALTLASCAALLIAHYGHLSFPWQTLNAILPLSITISLHSGSFHSAAGIILLILLLIYVPTFWTGVPFYPSNRKMYAAVLAQLPEDREFNFIDLGCGFGSLLFFLAKHRPLGRYTGVELSLLPYCIAKLRSWLPGSSQPAIKLQSIWTTELSDFDYIYAFLAPPPMPRLWEKVKKEAKAKTVLLVNSFPVPAPPSCKVAVDEEGRQAWLYLWTL